MVAPLAAKRMAKERQELEKASSQEEHPDYFVIFKDDNLFEFDAYIIAPDTIYRYRLVKLHFEIPQDDYPFKPPRVKFIQHTGHRIHPNLYVEGKVCLSILGYVSSPSWPNLSLLLIVPICGPHTPNPSSRFLAVTDKIYPDSTWAGEPWAFGMICVRKFLPRGIWVPEARLCHIGCAGLLQASS